MLLWALDWLYAYELYYVKKFLTCIQPLLNLWSNIYLEWLFLQIIIIYTIIRLFGTEQYFKQLITLLILIVLMCVYASILQYELFACFMFLGEFTIIIFFYCLFLHLKINVQQSINPTKNPLTLLLVLGLVVCSVFLINSKNVLFHLDDLYLIWPDLYKVTGFFLLNDLIFFFYFFTKYHSFLYILIGIFLLIMTMVLLYFINIYCMVLFRKTDAYKSLDSKLNLAKGMYDQTSHSIQKIWTNRK